MPVLRPLRPAPLASMGGRAPAVPHGLTGARPPIPAPVALAGVTAAAAATVARLFTGLWPAAILVAIAVATHVAVSLARRRLGPVPSASATLVILAALSAVALDPDAAFYGIPTAASGEAALRGFLLAWEASGSATAPVVPRPGFLLVATFITGVAAVAADALAFRLRRWGAAMLPSLALFTGAALLAKGRVGAGGTFLYLMAVLVFLASTPPGPASRQRARAHRRRLREAALIGVPVVSAALLLGPALLAGALPWRFEPGSPEVMLDDGIDIGQLLVDQPDVPLFTVDSPRPSYWRLATLEAFDGREWTMRAAGDGATMEPPPEIEGPKSSTYEFTLEGLTAPWLPVPPGFRGYSGPKGPSWNSRSGVLHAPGSRVSTYRVRSIPLSPALARSVERLQRGDPPDRLLDLPSRFSPAIFELARDVTEGATTRYGTALALERFFRLGFRYTEQLADHPEQPPLERFLLHDRRGFCVQFAGAFAAMARAAGIPARVAVGFTAGDLGDDGRYHVSGRHAHAWPEVYFGSAGWLPFEPTPGRALPTQEVPNDGRPLSGDVAEGRLSSLLAAIAVLAAGSAAGVPVTAAWRRTRLRRSWRRSLPPATRALAAWQGVERDLSRAGAPRHPAETWREHANRAPLVLGLEPAAGVAAAEAAEIAAEAAFGRACSAEAAERAVAAALTVSGRVPRFAPWRSRLGKASGQTAAAYRRRTRRVPR